MTIGDVLNTITERFHTTGHVKTVYGEPIEAAGKTIIPVAEVKYGFGGGGGQHPEAADQDSNAGAGQAHSGMGGGGGIGVRPVGVVEISERGTRYICFSQGRNIAMGVLAGMALAMVVFGRRRRRG